MSGATRVMAAFTLAFASAACAQILDIQEASVDPTLSSAIAGTSGTGAAAGGTSGTLSAGGETATHDNSGDAGALDHSSGGSGDHGGAESTAGSATAMAGARDEPNTCATYCDSVISNCKGKYEQYRTFDQCIEVCKRLPVGAVGDENVNSVECRMRQATFAESEPFVYCKSAGPLGAGKCGSNCVSYCALMQSTCTANSTAGNLEPSYFDTPNDCLSTCNGLPQNSDGPTQYSSSAMAEPSSFVGNNVFCRMYHVAAALEQDTPTEHCPHAMGGDPCDAQ